MKVLKEGELSVEGVGREDGRPASSLEEEIYGDAAPFAWKGRGAKSEADATTDFSETALPSFQRGEVVLENL